MHDVAIGCAGWSIPRQYRELFGDGDSVLARYATRFPVVEVNSSFYRSHRQGTYARWEASVPAGFRFSVKLPKTISHELALRGAGNALDQFLGEAEGLGGKLAGYLLQLPPSQRLDMRARGEKLGQALPPRVPRLQHARAHAAVRLVPHRRSQACDGAHVAGFRQRRTELLLLFAEVHRRATRRHLRLARGRDERGVGSKTRPVQAEIPAVCDALLDQEVFAGVGNIIKNEVLFRIGVHPGSQVGDLPWRKLGEMIKQARLYSFDFLEWKKQFVLRQHWQVHRKRSCPSCGEPLSKAHMGTLRRVAYFCGQCQTLY